MSVLLGFAERHRIDAPALASPTRRKGPAVYRPTPFARKAARLHAAKPYAAAVIEKLIDDLLAGVDPCGGKVA